MPAPPSLIKRQLPGPGHPAFYPQSLNLTTATPVVMFAQPAGLISRQSLQIYSGRRINQAAPDLPSD